jgi:hypothetical protein
MALRILIARFRTSVDLLASYDASYPGGALVYRTRAQLVPDEPVVLDVRLALLPAPVLVRGRVVHVELGRPFVSAWIALDPRDEAARDFLLDAARGAPVQGAQRRTQRFPIAIPIDWQARGSEDVHVSSSGDLSWTGTFVRTIAPAPVGTELSVVIDAPQGPLRLSGRALRAGNRTSGMAIRFTADNSDRQRLRRLLRAMDSRGKISFG